MEIILRQRLPGRNARTFPLSALEQLPDELLLMIEEEAGNPWLAYTCPQFHQLFETQKNREKYSKKAMKTFGTNIQMRVRPGSPTIHDYVAVFGAIVSLPWFMQAIFPKDKKKNKLITTARISNWTNTYYGMFACLTQPFWNQNLGTFVHRVMNRYSTHFLATRNCNQDVWKIACQTALTQGCRPAMRVLSGGHASGCTARAGQASSHEIRCGSRLF